ncbi:MAG: hypothetical protein ACNA7O_09245 [Rhodobacterales bacterium]
MRRPAIVARPVLVNRPALLTLGLAAVILAACGPLGIYHKPGTQVSTMNRALTNCEVEALGKVPVDRRVERDPVRIVPRRVCDSNGNCSVFYDRVGGEVRSYDNNAGLRQRVLNQCMADQGYRYVELPACSQAIKRAAPPGATTIMPQLATNSCAISNNDGTWQIVTPG